MTGILIWLIYFVFTAFVVSLGWRQKKRALSVVAAALLFAFALVWIWAHQGQSEPGWESGGAFGAGIMILLGAIFLVVPAVLGIAAFFAGRLWKRV
jgi:formate hydrogenlyase subunit 3/multisubunit Na+/H+ antiporter MnhD subunit